MSQKISSKNLSYDTTLPPFLARLRGQQAAGRDSDRPDPILAARRRPTGRTRTASEEAEDAPVVVDENGEVVDVQVAGDSDGEENVGNPKASGSGGGSGGGGPEQPPADEEEEKKERAGEKSGVTFGAGKKKRKVGRVVGGDEDEDKDAAGEEDQRTRGGQDEAREGTSVGGSVKDAKDVKETKPVKKKAKKIKLSFGDDEEG